MPQCGWELIKAERNRGIDKGHTPQDDAKAYTGEHQHDLVLAAAFLLSEDAGDITVRSPEGWMLELAGKQESYLDRLRVAGSLIAAEIDRVQLITLTKEG